MILDLGPETTKSVINNILECKTVVWAGPLGAFETEPFDESTKQIARAIAESDLISVAGGGDTISALKKADVMDGFTHVSTGGGAFLEYVYSRHTLYGLDALEKSSDNLVDLLNITVNL